MQAKIKLCHWTRKDLLNLLSLLFEMWIWIEGLGLLVSYTDEYSLVKNSTEPWLSLFHNKNKIKALLKIGIRGVTVSDVRGFGAQGGSTERHGGKSLNSRIRFNDSSYCQDVLVAFLYTLLHLQAPSSRKTILLLKLKWKSLSRKTKFVYNWTNPKLVKRNLSLNLNHIVFLVVGGICNQHHNWWSKDGRDWWRKNFR